MQFHICKRADRATPVGFAKDALSVASGDRLGQGLRTTMEKRGSFNWRSWAGRACRFVVVLVIFATSLDSLAWADETRIVGTARVIDGDTLDVGTARIRLHGIDAPEAGQRCGTHAGGSWRCGERATARLAELVHDKQIECTARDRDAYGRIIAVCYAEKANVNEILVREGLAWAFTRYSNEYVQVEASARSARNGVWQGEAEAPWDYRAIRWKRAAAESPRPGCPIKGNINRQGEKIYHTPWSPWYDRTRIDESKGQRWFCDEAEAEAAGWRPARWR